MGPARRNSSPQKMNLVTGFRGGIQLWEFTFAPKRSYHA